MLTPEKDNIVNMWRVIRQDQAGAVPAELSGFYTSKTLCSTAIDRYVILHTIQEEISDTRTLEKELWKKAKLMKGMNSRDAFEMLKAQHELESSRE